MCTSFFFFLLRTLRLCKPLWCGRDWVEEEGTSMRWVSPKGSAKKKKSESFFYRALTTGGMSLNAIVPVVGSMTRQRRSRFRMSIDGGFHFRNSWLFYHHVFLALLFSLCLRLFFFFFVQTKNPWRVFFFVFSCEVNSVLFFCHFTCFNLSVVQSPSFVFFFRCSAHILLFHKAALSTAFFFFFDSCAVFHIQKGLTCLPICHNLFFFFSSFLYIYIYTFFFILFFSRAGVRARCLKGEYFRAFFFWKDYPDQFCIPARPLSYPCVFFFCCYFREPSCFLSLNSTSSPLPTLFFFSLLTPSALLLVLLCSFYHFSFSFSFFTQRNARKELSLVVRSHRFVLEFQALTRRSLFFFFLLQFACPAFLRSRSWLEEKQNCNKSTGTPTTTTTTTTKRKEQEKKIEFFLVAANLAYNDSKRREKTKKKREKERKRNGLADAHEVAPSNYENIHTRKKKKKKERHWRNKKRV